MTRRRNPGLLPAWCQHRETAKDTPLGFLFVLTVGLLAGTISGIIGTGSSIMLMPVLVYQYGPKEAVPIMAVAAVMANLSRILAWWREVDWRACLAYSVTGIPAAALGARTLLALPRVPEHQDREREDDEENEALGVHRVRTLSLSGYGTGS